jgi:hypothetical protein
MKKNILLLIVIVSSLRMLAQTSNDISISLTVAPPYSPYISDYYDLLDDGIIIITNLTQETRTVKIVGQLEKDGQLLGSTSPNYQPSSPIVLGPLETRVINASEENQAFFDDQNMDFFVDRSTIITVAQTGILPEGNYSICLQALDYFTNSELSPAAPGGCNYLPILYAQPPIIASPLCNDTITVLNNIASFTWLPVTAPTTQPMLYDLYVVKMLSGVNPNDAIMGAINYGAGNPIIKTNLVTSSITTLPSDLPIEAGNWYAWCVVAHDPTNEVNIENNGRSEVCTFYSAMLQTTLNTSPVVIDTGLPTFQLLPFATLSGNIRYKFHGDAAVNASTIVNTGSVIGNISSFNNWYGNVGSTSGTGGTSGTSTTTTLSSGTITLDTSTLPDIIDTYELLGMNLSQPPAALMPENYLNLGGLPLKNVGLVFTSRFAVGKSLNVQSIDDLEIIRPNAGNVYFSANGGPLTNAGYVFQTSGSTSTNQYGDYSITLLISQPYGLLQNGPVTAQCGGGEFIDYYSGYGLYRLLTIEVTDPRFCHPDVYLFPQPNQGLDVPQQIVKVKSYNLNIEVKSNSQAAQQAGANNPIAGAVVRIGRIAEELNNFPPSYPQGESNIGSYGYSMSEAIPNIIQCDSAATNASGIATFKRLVRSTGSCNMTGETGYTSNVTLNDGYYVEAFTSEFIGSYNYHKKRVYRFAPCADGLGLTYDQHGVRSHEYTPPVHTLQIVLTPKDPEIYVSVRTDYGSGPVPVPNTNLLFEIKKPVSPTISWQMYQTDENGLFKKQISSSDYYYGFAWKSASGVFQSQYIVTAAKTGYEVLNCNGCSASGQHVALQMGQRWRPEVNMKPKGKVKGIVRDEDGHPIQGEVKIGEGVFIPLEMALTYVASNLNLNGTPTTSGSTLFNSTTSSFSGLLSGSSTTYGSTTTTYSVNTNYTTTNNTLSGTSTLSGISSTSTNAMFSNESVFDFPAQSGNDIMLIIRPSSTSLFVDTFYVDIPVNSTTVSTNLGIFIVKKKLHRPVITVRSGASALSSTPVTGATVTLSDLPTATTNTQGIASFLFGSPASEFRLQIQKNGFAQYDEHIVIPVSKNPYPITITLAPGYSVSGTVTNELTGAPIPNARVYCVTGTNAFGSITVETQTNNLGQYTLTNLPGGWRVLKAAASNESITYIAESLMRVLPVSAPVNFTLQPAPFHLPNIWNFQAEIASFAPITGGWKVSGALTAFAPNARFKMEKANQRLNFIDLPIAANGTGNNASGQIIAQPTAADFIVNENQVRAILNDQHIMSLSGVLSGGTGVSYTYSTGLAPMMLSKIKIQKNTSTGNGEVKCRAYTLLESFRMTYSYDGQFYLGETANASSISAFKAGENPSMPETYFLMNTNALGTSTNPEYTVHDFPAYADRSASYVRGDSLILATRLTIDIPLSNPEELIVDAGKIIVLPEEIQILSGTQPLNFDLEQWHVETNSWTFDEAYGGIVTSGTIETNSIDFEAPLIILRPDQLILPNANTISTSDLSVAGITPFNVNTGTNLSFGYYNAPAHDPTRGHWRIALFNPDLPAGYINGLPGWNSGVKLNFSYLENFSDGHLQFTVAPNQFINHYNVINQQITGLTKLSDGFALDGPVDLGIPNLGNGHSLSIVYYKEGGTTTSRLNGLYTTFETYGQVEFKGDQQANRITLDWNSLKVPGLMTIYDDASSNVIAVRAMLEKTPTQSRIDIMKLDAAGIMPGPNFQYINLGGGTDGKQKILEGTQLTQSAGWQPLSYHAQFEGYTGSMQAGSDHMWFTVSGAILNDADKSEPLKLTNIETPFGDLALTYHFDLMEIRGVINFENIPFGTVNINNGSAQFGLGGRGFFFVAEMNATYPTIGVLQTNMITGWYPEIISEASTKLKTGMYLKKLPEFMNEGIQGLYMCANKELLLINEEIDFGLFGGGLYIETGMDLRFWMNFGESYGGAHFGALAYCDAEVYAHVLHICEACFGLLAEVGLETDFQYNPSTDFSITICGSLGVNVSFCDISWSETAKVTGTLSTSNGAELGVSFGDSCGNPLSTNSSGCKHF